MKKREYLRYEDKEVRAVAESINIWLAIIFTTISIISALIAGLLFIWRAGGKFNSTLTNLNNGLESLDDSIQSLNKHLTKVDEKADKADARLDKHEIRLVKLEHRVGMEAVAAVDEKES